MICPFDVCLKVIVETVIPTQFLVLTLQRSVFVRVTIDLSASNYSLGFRDIRY
jgi:hypothetical protein